VDIVLEDWDQHTVAVLKRIPSATHLIAQQFAPIPIIFKAIIGLPILMAVLTAVMEFQNALFARIVWIYQLAVGAKMEEVAELEL